jgi:L-ascorbate metabolism protein UlaG (beta-lactamase superfamily)
MPLGIRADIVISSHDHFDHNNFKLIDGDYKLIREEGKYNIDGVKFEMIATWHDENQGKDRGKNLLMKFTLQDKVFLHCGDIGHLPSEDIFRKIGKVDILMIPVGGVYTIDAETAKQFSEIVKPKLVIPMHYKTPAVKINLAPISDFTAYCSRVIMNGSSELELTDDLFESPETEMIVFDYE